MHEPRCYVNAAGTVRLVNRLISTHLQFYIAFPNVLNSYLPIDYHLCALEFWSLELLPRRAKARQRGGGWSLEFGVWSFPCYSPCELLPGAPLLPCVPPKTPCSAGSSFNSDPPFAFRLCVAQPASIHITAAIDRNCINLMD